MYVALGKEKYGILELTACFSGNLSESVAIKLIKLTVT